MLYLDAVAGCKSPNNHILTGVLARVGA
jgi:hypothetical protein